MKSINDVFNEKLFDKSKKENGLVKKVLKLITPRPKK